MPCGSTGTDCTQVLQRYYLALTDFRSMFAMLSSNIPSEGSECCENVATDSQVQHCNQLGLSTHILLRCENLTTLQPVHARKQTTVKVTYGAESISGFGYCHSVSGRLISATHGFGPEHILYLSMVMGAAWRRELIEV